MPAFMTPETHTRLARLANDISKLACKSLRFGVDSNFTGPPNMLLIERAIESLRPIIQLSGLDERRIGAAQNAKSVKLKTLGPAAYDSPNISGPIAGFLVCVAEEASELATAALGRSLDEIELEIGDLYAAFDELQYAVQSAAEPNVATQVEAPSASTGMRM